MQYIDKNTELDFERVCILYSNMHITFSAVIASVVFLYFVIHEYAPPNVALIWALSVIVTYFPRLILTVIFNSRVRNHKINPNNIRPWEHYFFLNSILPFLCFTAVIYLPFQEGEDIGILVGSFIIMCITAGSILTYSTSRITSMLFLSISALSIIIRSFMVHEFLFTMLGLVVCVGYFLLMKLMLGLNKILIENISLKIEHKNYSLKDPLTRLWNRRHLYLYIEQLIPLSNRSGDQFSIIILDIDHFKKYNDTHGHLEGDELLIKVAKQLVNCSRQQDLIVRYGGEEFLLVLPSTNIEQAKVIAERIISAVSKNTNVTVSAGLSVYTGKSGFDQLVEQADKALYAAKKAGRNRFMVAVNNRVGDNKKVLRTED